MSSAVSSSGDGIDRKAGAMHDILVMFCIAAVGFLVSFRGVKRSM